LLELLFPDGNSRKYRGTDPTEAPLKRGGDNSASIPGQGDLFIPLLKAEQALKRHAYEMPFRGYRYFSIATEAPEQQIHSSELCDTEFHFELCAIVDSLYFARSQKWEQKPPRLLDTAGCYQLRVTKTGCSCHVGFGKTPLLLSHLVKLPATP
jgi:hypothetical protein